MEPRYQIPLSPEHLKELGRLTAIWGQLDNFLLLSIAGVAPTHELAVEIMLDKVMMAGRVMVFGRLAKYMPNPDLRAMIKKFCSRSGEVIGRRNHITHGLWGLLRRDGKPDAPVCFFRGDKKTLIFADELESIADKAAELTLLLAKTKSMIYNLPEYPDTPSLKLFFGYGPPPEHTLGSPGQIYMDLTAADQTAT